VRRIFPAAAIVAAACALALAGCGSSGSSDATGSKPGDGKQIFTDAGCGGCHTLAAAGSNGSSGPNLDEVKPDAPTVAKQVKNGGGGMPSFGGKLTETQIAALSEYVASSAGR
jgi:mono/diheme cytochrome c family protein